ncbi:MAG: hypothetical protein Q8K87_02130, partial [Hydrogenophaga sp.]|nr:hypothetical protein [Hydrogenophaga sp.]
MKNEVNSSGFPLQIAIKNVVDATSSLHGWSTVFTEHAWKHPGDQDSGFIDLVLKNSSKTQILLLECKRVKSTQWHFLVENNKPDRRHAKSFVFRANGENINRFEWLDLTMSPSTPESSFCVIPGTGQDVKKTLIERASGELLSSCEALAHEDRRLMLKDRDTYKIYSNAIVTTATLYVCKFDPKDISIGNGEINNPEFLEVPYIRFRKQLLTSYSAPDIYAVFGDRELSRAKESTIFVVNAAHLT